MSLFYQHNINAGTKVGIWRIEEPESFYLGSVPLKRDVSHPAKRLQHLAGRYLLPYLFHDFPLSEILIADTRKPYLPDEKYHFSISHCGSYAGVIASNSNRVGIDIEIISPRLYNIVHKFVNDKEKIFLEEWEPLTQMHLELTTILWSAKEALFKWYGLGQVDFKEHMQLSGPVIFLANEWIELPFTFSKHENVHLKIMARVFGEIVLAWVVT
ncbi:MAG: 4'-phosphopantetheinyl transferase superfamily protein [Chitinophagaceae bacterium]|nr:MAG: 4'-phosphopantetheinyl transferase superfamily protein [Chitinophagaceae bacterium]